MAAQLARAHPPPLRPRPATRYVDTLGSVVIAFYLLYQAFQSSRQEKIAQLVEGATEFSN